MSAKLRKHLEKKWNNASELKERLAIIKLYAEYCDKDSAAKLKKFRAYFSEDCLIDAPISQLERIITGLRKVDKRLASFGDDTGIRAGRAFTEKLSSADQRRASRTLSHPMVKGVTNHHLESDSDIDSFDEFRAELMGRHK
jgi:hypothetical protein